jgi:hypothetical protein
MKRSTVILAALNALSFVAMVVVNGLANALPLNGRGTGEISDSYPNLFVPIGLTFSIWGLIYLLLLGFTLFGLVVALKGSERAEGVKRLGPFFFLSSLANLGWIFAWHWERLALSLVLMLVILASLILGYLRLGIGRERFDLWGKLFLQIPFSVYLGWITVATIANVTALLVSLEWGGFGLSEVVWTVIMILAAVVITLAMIMTRGDVAYTLVVVWALLGIFLKRSAADDAPAVAWTAIIGAAALLVAAIIARFYFARRRATS